MIVARSVNYTLFLIVEDPFAVAKKSRKNHDWYSEKMLSAHFYSFSKTPEIPRVSYPFKTISYAGSIKIGGEISFFYPNGTVSGYFTKQELESNTIKTAAYGYLYSDQAGNNENVLHDYNREKGFAVHQRCICKYCNPLLYK